MSPGIQMGIEATMAASLKNNRDFVELGLEFFFLMIRLPPRSTPFPTRRSSDLLLADTVTYNQRTDTVTASGHVTLMQARDRKSTRLNSSHVQISYAVFCLKK